MPTLLEQFKQSQQRDVIPDVRPGDVIRVHERIEEGDNSRIQVFEGLLIARNHGDEPGATIMVRKISHGVGVERTFLLHSPRIEKIEITKRSKVRRAKLYYMRERRGRAARIQGEQRSDSYDMRVQESEVTEEETGEPVVPEEGEAEPATADEAVGEEMMEKAPGEKENNTEETPQENEEETEKKEQE